jgi:phage gp29-like protein
MPILDQHGQPITSTPPQPRASGGAVSLSDRYRQYPANGLTPVKLAAILREADDGFLERQSELFETMIERDAYLFSLFQTRKLAVTGLDWTVDPAEDTPEARKIADAWTQAWEELDTEDLMLELLDAIDQGVSLLNVVWERVSGTWVPSALTKVQPRNLIWDFDERRFLVRTLETPRGEALPFGAGIEHRFKARSGLPVRAGLGRTISWLYLFKHYALKDWLVYADLYGVPFRLGKYDPATGEAERQALETAVRALGSDAAGVISKDTEIEIIDVAQKGGPDVFDKLSSGEGSHGTQALGKVHERVRLDILKADARALAATVRRDLIRAFVAFNFGPDKIGLAPYLNPQIEEPEDLKLKAEVLQITQNMGLEIPTSWMREQFGVPEPQPQEATLTRPTPPQNPVLNGVPAPVPPTRAANQMRQALEGPGLPSGVIEGQAFATGVIGNATDAARAAMSENLGAILEIVDAADGFDDLISRLIAAFPDLNPDALTRLAQSAMVMADLAGQYAQRQGP